MSINQPVSDRAKIPGMKHQRGEPTEYTAEEVDFMFAVERYMRLNRRPFPTWSEVLSVVHAMGYRRVAAAETPAGDASSQNPSSRKKEPSKNE